LETQRYKLDSPHAFLAEELLQPNSNKCDCSRTQMWTSHVLQIVNLENPEIPRVQTTFENQVGQVSDSYLKAPNDLTVISVIARNSKNTTIIAKDNVTNEILAIEIPSTVNITESYGYSVLKGDVLLENKNNEVFTIPKNSYIFRPTTIDENDNLQYGVNLNTVYLSYESKTYEDAIIVSETTARERLKYINVSEVTVTLNTNDILTNTMGNEENFKSFPEIGEDIIDNILCNRRRINYDNVASFSNKALLDITAGNSTPFYITGVVEDIEVFNNSKEVINNPQIRRIYEEQQSYYKNIFNILSLYEKNKTCKLTDDALALLGRARHFVSDEPWSYESEFDNLVLRFRIKTFKPATAGCKISNRYGNKGVISKIEKDENMPFITNPDGSITRADVILNCLGVINRLNPPSLYELELNYISDQFLIQLNMDKTLPLIDKFDKIINFITDINASQGTNMRNLFWKEFKNNPDMLAAYFNEIIDQKVGLFIEQPPFYNNISWDVFKTLYDKYNVTPFNLGTGSVQKVIISKMYFIQLKHHPSGKFSARSARQTNIRGLPAKSRDKKDFLSLYSNTPIRLGEQELMNLMVCANTGIGTTLFDFLNAYSANTKDRQNMIDDMLKTDNPNLNLIPVHKESPSETLTAYLQTIGTVLVRTDVKNIDEVSLLLNV
jgi:DNA-directed RNA polymerase beta subunit